MMMIVTLTVVEMASHKPVDENYDVVDDDNSDGDN